MAQPTFELQPLDVTEGFKNCKTTPDGEDGTRTPGQTQPPSSREPQQSPPRTTVLLPAVIRDTSPQPTVPDVTMHPGRFHVDRPAPVMYDAELGLVDDDKWWRQPRWERRGGYVICYGSLVAAAVIFGGGIYWYSYNKGQGK
ncbi:hypothetical protein BDD12DRAFT_807703 [Trichophaea hybrida]|nr:hypothetical protein BDD12DRAFT_807703 [Trichophaea hybrida]